jgi:hypothetical protein
MLALDSSLDILLDACLSRSLLAAIAFSTSLEACLLRGSLATLAPGGLLDVCLSHGSPAALALGGSVGGRLPCSSLATLPREPAARASLPLDSRATHGRVRGAASPVSAVVRASLWSASAGQLAPSVHLSSPSCPLLRSRRGFADRSRCACVTVVTSGVPSRTSNQADRRRAHGEASTVAEASGADQPAPRPEPGTAECSRLQARHDPSVRAMSPARPSVRAMSPARPKCSRHEPGTTECSRHEPGTTECSRHEPGTT